ARVVARWGGPIAFTPQRAPVLGRLPDIPDVIVSAGCAGHGIALGVRVGQLVAEAIVEGVPLPAWGALPGAPPTRSGRLRPRASSSRPRAPASAPRRPS